MRNSSPAKSAASSPPVPARISTITFFSSFGSFGSSRTFSSRSTVSLRAASCFSSSSAICFISGSSASSDHLLRAREFLIELLPLAVFFDHLGKLRMPPRELLVIRRIVQNFRRRKLRGHFDVAVFNLIELFVKR